VAVASHDVLLESRLAVKETSWRKLQEDWAKSTDVERLGRARSRDWSEKTERKTPKATEKNMPKSVNDKKKWKGSV